MLLPTPPPTAPIWLTRFCLFPNNSFRYLNEKPALWQYGPFKICFHLEWLRESKLVLLREPRLLNHSAKETGLSAIAASQGKRMDPSWSYASYGCSRGGIASNN